MNEPIYIIINNSDVNPYTPVLIHSNYKYHLENLFGFFDDFSYKIIKRIEQINLLPSDSIKLFLNLCSLPNTPYLNFDKKIIKFINKDKNSYLWFFSPHEVEINYELLLNFLKSIKINFNKVVVTNSNIKLQKTKHNTIKFCSIPEWWEAYYRYTVNTKDDTSFIDPDEKYKKIDKTEKKILSLNRNVKIHRIWFYQNLQDNLMLDEGFISYHLPEIATQIKTDLKTYVIKNLCYDLKLQKKILNNKNNFTNRSLDVIQKKYVINNQNSIRDFFIKSLVNFTTESSPTEDFLTEKTFKNITHSQPFILIGSSTLGNMLRERGYKTYDNIFDIDCISDYKSSTSILNKIANMSFNDLKQKVIESKNIVEHNWDNFFNRKISFIKLLENIQWMIKNDQ